MTAADQDSIDEVKRKLETILSRLDELGLSQAGAYLSMAIDCVEGEADSPAEEE